ncbi:TonB-dependent receptor plug domain-containing protein [Halorhodospira halochloris]|uniref:TonB-dependent receptor plug domain-containing protein n=1 Tax=Halorhodospira halochloris TaxID=1052 RepID=UPI001EE7ED57|nr:TonB-dependent receptor [Halorhodospira halochloris]MCG5549014.1 TonB-dependent receptor [Halorhodospira halochloris]
MLAASYSAASSAGDNANDSLFHHGLDPVTVTAPTRSERARDESPGSIEVITSEQIKRSGATMLDQVLRNQSSMFVSPDGTEHSIRGAKREDTVILIDGRRVLGEPSRRYALNRIPTGRIDRIEIVKGPGSVLYGSDALGGVINIVTRRPEPGLQGGIDLQAGARTEDGDAQQYNASFNLLGGSTDTLFSLFGQFQSRDGYKEEETGNVGLGGDRKTPSDDSAPGWANNLDLEDTYTIDQYRRDEADVYTIGGSIEHWFNNRFSVTLEGSYMKEERRRDYINTGRNNTSETNNSGDHRPAFNIPVSWQDDNQRYEIAASADWQATENLALNHRIYYSRYEKDRFVPVIPYQDLGWATQSDSDFRERDITLADLRNEFLSTWTPDPNHTLQLGFEHLDHEQEDHIDGQQGSTRWQAGVFAQHEWQATDRLDVIYGARYDDASIDQDNTSVEGGIVYALAPQMQLRANYAQGFKYPDTRDLYTDTHTPAGDLNLGARVIRGGKTEAHELDPEESENLEIGLRGRLGTPRERELRYDLSAFYTEIDNRIEQVRYGNQGYRTFYNIGKSRARGLEAAIEADWSPKFGTDLSVTWLEDASWREVTHEGLDYEFIPNAPEFSGIASIRWQPSEAWSLQARARFTDEYYTATDDDEVDESYTTVDLNANYRPTNWEGTRFYAAVDNIFDEGNDSSLYADPGRFARVGMEYEF